MRRLLIEKMSDYRNHRIVGPPALHPCGDGKRRAMVTEHMIAVPLLHVDLGGSSPSSSAIDSIVVVDRVDAGFDSMESFDGRPTIDVYFAMIELISNSDSDEAFLASMSDPDLDPRRRAEAYLRRASAAFDASRAILYLQGGPGFGCAAPVSGLSLASSKSSWASSALFGDVTNLDGSTFDRVILMDQRGTGRSSPISRRSLEKMFPDLFLLDDDEDDGTAVREGSAEILLRKARASRAVADAADYLTKFRADSIVRDAEWIREALLCRPSSPLSSSTEDAASREKDEPPPRPWGAALGQSFGGFCLMTYLSSIANPPRLCLFTGGIAPMDTPVREVYDRLWLRVKERNLRYYDRYPGDAKRVKKIVRRLLLHETDPSMSPISLPSGGTLTARRFLQLGLALGGSPGSSFANIHDVVGLAFSNDEDEELSFSFLKRIEREQSFDDAPLYFLLHESIYADGPRGGSTNWAAHSSYEHYASTNREFDYRVTSSMSDDDRNATPTMFFGEMVFPWMAHGEYKEVSGRGMRSLSEALAMKGDWLPLYDSKNMRAALLGTGEGPSKSKAASVSYFDDLYVDFDLSMKLVSRGGPLEGVKVWITNEYQHSGLRDDGANIVCKLVSMAKGTIHVPS
ncbi:hypothetical protein ACHAW5_001269 [Stephanodiscus triporus]|uniref:AB hydrolase-1 domain-containing protein n=1 Tax=Stephanodiscus triporus TaxID=2934178 RepID=A0ABD3QG73_9STRA